MEAASCFWDPLQVAFYDPDHSDDEDREILIGHSNRDRLLMRRFPVPTADVYNDGRRLCRGGVLSHSSGRV